MRIRSIRPEFWASEDVAALDWNTRLVFIGLWSYVDDNGVGRDVERLITASLFPLDDNPRDTLATVSRALSKLSEGGQVTRYTHDGKTYLHITAWTKHQKIDKPAKARYPLPTCENAVITPPFATPSRHPRDTPSTGEGEKGRRGEGEELPPSFAGAVEATNATHGPTFDAFWTAYPRKVGKDDALKAWKTARRHTAAIDIVAGAHRLANDPNLPDKQFIPHPATWLRAGRWADEPLPPRNDTRSRHQAEQNATDDFFERAMRRAQDAEAAQAALHDRTSA